MIDPSKITNYNQTFQQLEESILFWIIAAGKNGTHAAKCLNKLLSDLHLKHHLNYFAPFKVINLETNLNHSSVSELLFKYKTGAQNIKSKTIIDLIKAELDLHKCTREELIKIWGIGLKTASCFILHSRPNIQMAGIDTHILKFLQNNGSKYTKVNKNNYHILEKHFLDIANKLNISPAEYDLLIWNSSKIIYDPT